ncbi:uncharacterized protein IUM83_11571 [Phytophthora cinnamomi]|uniref:uncharacterized protein n=1 Tax=Phytophthora cinnamomi TaxID=4785 RepID=UPI00355A7F43|nr:hypothetical protein IUM83_11571 [Phytophthora cinnamomi]
MSNKRFEHREDGSDYQDENEMFSALPPTPQVVGGYSVPSSGDDQERDEEEEAEVELEETRRPGNSDNGDQDENQDDGQENTPNDDEKQSSDNNETFDNDKKDDSYASSKSK